MNTKLHNWIFASIVLIVLIATGWSVAARDPSIAGGKIEAPIVNEKKDVPQNQPAKKDEQKKDVVTELIDKKLLSKQPAKFYRKVEE